MRKLLAFVVCALLALGVAACGNDDDENSGGGGGGGGDISGSIKIDGSSTVGPFAQAAAEQFKGENPGVKISVGTSGTGGGFEKFCAGETDISNASRSIKDDEEVPLCKKEGITYKEVQVANDGIAIATNTSLKVDCLTVDELKKLWNKGSKVKSLSELNPEHPDTQLSLFGPGTDSGTFDFFTDEINGEEGASRDDYQPSEDDNVLVQGVSGDKGGLGYFGFSYYEQNKDKLNLVGVDAGVRLRQARQRRHPERQVQATLPSAVHVSEREGPQAARDQGVHGLRDRELRRDRGGRSDRPDGLRTDRQGQDGARVAGLEAGTAAARATSGAPALGVARRRWGEEVIKGLLVLAAFISVLTTVGIVISLLGETIVFFGEIGVADYIFGTEWSPFFKPGSFGVVPLISGTFLITGIALIVAIPLGLGSALYLSEYAKPRTRRTIKPVLELLAGVPTIVFGYFALTFFTPEILRGLFNADVSIFNALAGGIVIGFMIVPTIASVSEDAMGAVPQSLREGAFGLGASKLQVSMRVVFPAALSGIVAATVLGISRAVGETMIVLVAAGQVPNLTADPRQPVETMTAFIGATARGDVATGSTQYKTIFAVGATLFVITLIMNAISIRFVRKYRQVYE